MTNPAAVVISPDGLNAISTDYLGHRVRLIDINTKQVTNLAGDGTPSSSDGVGTNAQFNQPMAASYHPDGLTALIGTYNGNLLRHIDIASKQVTPVAGDGTSDFSDGVGTNAQFHSIDAVAYSPDGLTALMGDIGNNRVRQIDLATLQVTTLAGDGTAAYSDGIGTNAQFDGEFALSYNPNGLTALVSSSNNNRIQQIDLATKQVTTLAGNGDTNAFGDGVGTNAMFWEPRGVDHSPDGSRAIINDAGNRRIREIDLATLRVTTLAGNGVSGGQDGVGGGATFGYQIGISYSPDALRALIADFGNHKIRAIDLPIPTPAPTAGPTLAPTKAPTTPTSALRTGRRCSAFKSIIAPLEHVRPGLEHVEHVGICSENIGAFLEHLPTCSKYFRTGNGISFLFNGAST
jgi:DNA-binding beta-propeller fold protein YncE